MPMIPERQHQNDFMLCRNCKKNKVEQPYAAWSTSLVRLPAYWCECCREKILEDYRREGEEIGRKTVMASLKNENAMIIKSINGVIDGIGELRKRWSDK